MEVGEITALVKVVQAGSFTRAAEIMGTQKAHLSRLISNLEKKLGARLLQRSTRSLSLTEIGREVFERSVGILAAIEETERIAQLTLSEPGGNLKLTCGVEFGMIAVNRWINEFLQQHPQVSINADYSSRTIDLIHEGFDLAIRVGPLPDSRLTARKLGDITYGLYASPDYLHRRGLPRHPCDLSRHDLLVFSGGNQIDGWVMRKGDASARSEGYSRLTVNNSFTVKEAAINSQGIAKLPEVIADASVKGEMLVRILPEWVLDAVPVHAIFPSNRYLAPKVRAFIDHAVQNFPKISSKTI
jgi:DNA-binding transcriptional LysR family regulator